jgi:hypothetical protein
VSGDPLGRAAPFRREPAACHVEAADAELYDNGVTYLKLTPAS